MDSRASNEPIVSVVIPLYDEEDNVRPLIDQLYQVLNALGVTFEVILIDDGSRDATYRKIRGALHHYPHLRAIRLRRNFGQTAAICAGVDHALGQVIVTMDGDLQSDPNDIPRFVEEILSGVDVVVGWRKKRYDHLWTRKVPSWVANRLIGMLTGVNIRDNGCALKAFRARIIKSAPLYADRHRFIPSILSALGPRARELEVNHRPRKFGRSKYGLSRVHKVLLDLTVVSGFQKVSLQPMRFLGTLGLAISTFGVMFIAMAIAGVLEPVSASIIGTMMAASGFTFGLWGALCQLLLTDTQGISGTQEPSYEEQGPLIASLGASR